MSPDPGRRAFTLVEMLVAVALFALLMSILMAALTGSITLTTTATRHLITSRTARESLDEIGHELALAALPWQRTSMQSLQLLINPPGIVPLQDANPDAIFWQASLAHANDFGNLAVVGYFVLRDVNASAPALSRLQLRKVFISPTAPASPGNYLLYSSPSAWMTAGLISGFAPDTVAADMANGEEGWVADGVLGLWVRCLDKAGAPITLNAAGAPINSASANTYDSRAAYRAASANPGYYSYPASFTALPAYVEVTMVCVAPAEIIRITSLPAAPSSDATNFDAPIDAYVQSVAQANPGVKSVAKFSRTFRLYESD